MNGKRLATLPHRPYRWSRGDDVRWPATPRNAEVHAKGRRYLMSTATARTVSAPRWMLWTGWLLSLIVVAQLLSSAWFRATHHTYAVAEIVTGYGYPAHSRKVRGGLPVSSATVDVTNAG